MKTSTNHTCECGKMHLCGQKSRGSGSAGQAVYGLGVVGAAIYFISNAASFWLGALGILKAIFWPAFVVFELMKHLNM